MAIVSRCKSLQKFASTFTCFHMLYDPVRHYFFIVVVVLDLLLFAFAVVILSVARSFSMSLVLFIQ